MSRSEKAYSNSKYNIACANKLNKTVQFYSPEFAKFAIQGENTASIDESSKQSVRATFITP